MKNSSKVVRSIFSCVDRATTVSKKPMTHLTLRTEYPGNENGCPSPELSKHYNSCTTMQRSNESLPITVTIGSYLNDESYVSRSGCVLKEFNLDNSL